MTYPEKSLLIHFYFHVVLSKFCTQTLTCSHSWGQEKIYSPGKWN